jgi:hypothetical protein
LRDTISREQLAFRDFLKPPITAGRDVEKANFRRRRRVDAMRRRLGSTPDELRRTAAAAD